MLVPPNDAPALAAAVRGLIENPDERRVLRERGLGWAGDHTAERQAERMVGWLRGQFPNLAW